MKKDIKKPNQLIRASHDMTLQQQRLFLAALSQVNDNDDKTIEGQIDLSEICDLKNDYRAYKQAARKLTGYRIEVEQDGAWEYKTLFDSFRGIDYQPIIRFRFGSSIFSEVVMLKKRFTLLKAKLIFKLKGVYSLRLYELLKIGHKEYKHVDYTIDELRKMFNIPDHKHKRFDSFKRSVIDKPIQEINELTDLDIEVELLRKWRAVEKVRFIYRDYKTIEIGGKEAKSDRDRIAIKNLLTDLKVSESYIRSLDKIDFDFEGLRKELEISLRFLKRMGDEERAEELMDVFNRYREN